MMKNTPRRPVKVTQKAGDYRDRIQLNPKIPSTIPLCIFYTQNHTHDLNIEGNSMNLQSHTLST